MAERRSNIFIALAVIFLVLGIGGLIVVCAMNYATRLSKLEVNQLRFLSTFILNCYH